jgi:predicted aldo/keto reductase-like oxidoreductase
MGEQIDIERTKAMVDKFLAAGFTYFDTSSLSIGFPN